ncbi:MAG: outer membrane protein assembly factor BamB family protein, partial [Verrucomicrobiia bacterium]
MRSFGTLALLFLSNVVFADWPQGAGSSGGFRTSQSAPTEWSVVRNENIAWKLTLPETGQSTPVVSGGKVFFTTVKEVDADAEVARDVVAWCCDVETGKVLWQRDIPGKHFLRISGAFSDSSAPPAVSDGKRVVFVNASGGIACFDLNGKALWNRDLFSVGRGVPFLSAGKLVYTRQIYPPTEEGKFPHSYA